MLIRRYFSVLFLFLMVLNTVGYYSFLVIFEKQLTREVLEKIEANVHEITGNMIIKVPLSLPYATDPGEYQPVNGQFIYQDTVYQLIKQRLYKDTLYVVCIRDYRTTEAKEKVKAYTSSFAGEGKQQCADIKVSPSFAKYFFSNNRPITICYTGWVISDQCFHDLVNLYRYNSNRYIFHPPKFTA